MLVGRIKCGKGAKPPVYILVDLKIGTAKFKSLPPDSYYPTSFDC